jgi:hypothetical protein
VHDLLMSPTWDLVPNGQGGLSTADGPTVDYQDVNYRVLTNNPDHQLWPVGADLEDLIGQSNNQITGNQAIANVLRALTFDGRFIASSLSISAVPINQSQIQVFVGVKDGKVQTTQPYFSLVISL